MHGMSRAFGKVRRPRAGHGDGATGVKTG